MPAYDNERRGVLFKNNLKREDRRDPDYRGRITIGGVEFWLDAWLEKSKDDVRYMSLKARPKDEPSRAEPAPQQSAPSRATASEFNDDIPF